MKTAIEVSSMREADLMKQALADPEIRAVVDVVGALLTLPDDARARVVKYVTTRLEAEQATPAARS